MTEQNFTTLITGIIGLVGAMFGVYMNYKLALLSRQSEKTAKVADATHTLVNKNMGTQLRVSAALAMRVANLTNDPQDVLIWEEADKQRKIHDEQQAKVDAKNPDGVQPAGKS